MHVFDGMGSSASITGECDTLPTDMTDFSIMSLLTSTSVTWKDGSETASSLSRWFVWYCHSIRRCTKLSASVFNEELRSRRWNLYWYLFCAVSSLCSVCSSISPKHIFRFYSKSVGLNIFDIIVGRDRAPSGFNKANANRVFAIFRCGLQFYG